MLPITLITLLLLVGTTVKVATVFALAVANMGVASMMQSATKIAKVCFLFFCGCFWFILIPPIRTSMRL
jgi:hypothetical protein